MGLSIWVELDRSQFPFFVFSTAIAPALFGYLIDHQFSINQIFTMMLGYLVFANLLLLLKFRDYKPVKIA